jgi:shikimate kinase
LNVDDLGCGYYPVSMASKEGIVLIGMAGVGKSTVGLALARALGFNFTDLDEYIFEKGGKTVQEIIDNCGEDALINLEKARILELDIKRRVIAPGGSIIYNSELMDYLKKHTFLVYLNDSIENISRRLNNASSRGIVGLKRKSLREIYDERRPLYARYAVIIVEMEGKSQGQVVGEILKQYGDLR